MSRRKGWHKPAGVVYVGRPTKWGNPFIIGVDAADRETVIAMYQRWISTGRLPPKFEGDRDNMRARRRRILDEAPHELRGHSLGCWCPLEGPCHADALLRIANE
jgi:hypothetical protein